MNKQPISASEILQYAIGGAQLEKNRALRNFSMKQNKAAKDAIATTSDTLLNLFSETEVAFPEILRLAFIGAKRYARAMHTMQLKWESRYEDNEPNPWESAYKIATQDADEIVTKNILFYILRPQTAKTVPTDPTFSAAARTSLEKFYCLNLIMYMEERLPRH